VEREIRNEEVEFDNVDDEIDEEFEDDEEGWSPFEPIEKGITYRRTSPKIGRNETCPCGSGKKYKKCHGR